MISFNYDNGELVSSPTIIVSGTSLQVSSGLVKFTSVHFPPQYGEINNNCFKTIVHLVDGFNSFVVEVYENGVLDSQGVAHVNGPSVDTVSLQLILQPLPVKPIHLCLIVAKDSPGRYDIPLNHGEIANVDNAIRKLQVVARLMQAYTHDEMKLAGYGNRTFQFVEQTSDVDIFDGTTLNCKNVKVHILNSPKTVSELRDPEVAQQNKLAKESGWLFSHAVDLVEQSDFYVDDGTATQAACLYLDSTWDKLLQLILAHAALGGGSQKVKMAIFGSHGLHSWPTTFQKVIPCFLDDTKLIVDEVANDNGQCGTPWQTLNVTAGAFLHEIGHSLGCPHQADGVMLRDYVRWNRSFTEKSLNNDAPVCHWNKLDLIRFLYHDSFSLPNDSYKKVISTTLSADDSCEINKQPSIYLCNEGVTITSASGIYLIEIFIGEQARYYRSFLPQLYGGNGTINEYVLDFKEACNELVQSGFSTEKLSLRVLSLGGNLEIEDISSLMKPNDNPVESSIILSDFGLGKGDLTGYKSFALGRKINDYQIIGLDIKNIETVRVYHGRAVDGLRFFNAASTNNAFEKMFVQLDSSMLIGKESPKYSDFKIYENEYINKFHVRNGWWIDGIQLETNLGRKSPMYGNGEGGNLSTLECPNNKSTIVGMYCFVGKWLDLIGIVYTQDLPTT